MQTPENSKRMGRRKNGPQDGRVRFTSPECAPIPVSGNLRSARVAIPKREQFTALTHNIRLECSIDDV